MIRFATRLLAGSLLLALLIFPADWLLWRFRVAMGGGMDSVAVTRVTVTSLKGNKEEYYFDGTDVLPCTRSLLPPPTADGWGTPCWWLRGHRQVITQY